jgi:hypothetical protein
MRNVVEDDDDDDDDVEYNDVERTFRTVTVRKA